MKDPYFEGLFKKFENSHLVQDKYGKYQELECTNFVDMSDTFKYEHSKKGKGWGTLGDFADGFDFVDDGEIMDVIGTVD